MQGPEQTVRVAAHGVEDELVALAVDRALLQHGLVDAGPVEVGDQHLRGELGAGVEGGNHAHDPPPAHGHVPVPGAARGAATDDAVDLGEDVVVGVDDHSSYCPSLRRPNLPTQRARWPSGMRSYVSRHSGWCPPSIQLFIQLG